MHQTQFSEKISYGGFSQIRSHIMQIILEMLHSLGQKCSSHSMVLDTSKALCHRWNVLMPAILMVAEETKLRDIPDDATYEGILNPVYRNTVGFILH